MDGPQQKMILRCEKEKNEARRRTCQVERRPHGWAIFLHPDAGDPVACVYYLDDGRTLLLPETHISNEIEIVDDVPPELDAI